MKFSPMKLFLLNTLGSVVFEANTFSWFRALDFITSGVEVVLSDAIVGGKLCFENSLLNCTIL